MMQLLIYKLNEITEPPLCSLSNGEHLLGRGQPLQCLDKRVSRKHAEIQVSDDTATITAKHEINPCFYRAAESKHITILSFNKPVELNNGDAFGFFPDQYWFKVRFLLQDANHNEGECNGVANAETETRTSDAINEPIDEALNEAIDECNVVANATETCTSDAINEPIDEALNEAIDEAFNEAVDEALNEAINESLNEPCRSFDNIVNTTTVDNDIHNNSTLPTDNNDIHNNTTITTEESNLNCNINETGGENTVKIKQEPFEEPSTSNYNPDIPIKEEPPDAPVKTEPPDTPTSDHEDNNTASSCAGDKAQKKTYKDRCWYGASCYRRNGVHRTQFTHPGDPDYDTDPDDDRPQCQYGGSCYRRNKDHRKDFKHSRFNSNNTANANPATPTNANTATTTNTNPTAATNKNTKKRKPKKRAGNSDDESGNSNDDAAVTSANIVNTKRPRKKKKQADTPEDDYDYSDPFLDDGSEDDYVLESDDSDSDYH